MQGNLGDDALRGDTGNDVLSGGAGADVIDGGSGFDRASYATAPTTDAATNAGLVADLLAPANNTGEAAGDTYNLIEALVGSAFNDSLRGDQLNNSLFGNAGVDSLFGLGGNDKLIGGTGRDVLVGGPGNDLFDFNTTAETDTTTTTRDQITDFTHLSDTIDLSTIDAIAGGANDAFNFIGTAAFTAAGQARVFQSGADTIVALNTSGTGGAEAQILLIGVTATTLSVDDFNL